jgi:hypothetical protein
MFMQSSKRVLKISRTWGLTAREAGARRRGGKRAKELNAVRRSLRKPRPGVRRLTGQEGTIGTGQLSGRKSRSRETGKSENQVLRLACSSTTEHRGTRSERCTALRALHRDESECSFATKERIDPSAVKPQPKHPFTTDCTDYTDGDWLIRAIRVIRGGWIAGKLSNSFLAASGDEVRIGVLGLHATGATDGRN